MSYRHTHSYLVEVVESFVQVGVHAHGRLVGDLDGVLQDALWDDVPGGGGGRLGADEDAELWVAALAVLLQLLLQGAQPLGHQMDVLGKMGDGETHTKCLTVLRTQYIHCCTEYKTEENNMTFMTSTN